MKMSSTNNAVVVRGSIGKHFSKTTGFTLFSIFSMRHVSVSYIVSVVQHMPLPQPHWAIDCVSFYVKGKNFSDYILTARVYATPKLMD